MAVGSAATVASGEIGQLIVRGPQAMSGYWNNPFESAKKLKAGWLYTGDLFSRDAEGFFHFHGRAGGMLASPEEVAEKIRGIVAARAKEATCSPSAAKMCVVVAGRNVASWSTWGTWRDCAMIHPPSAPRRTPATAAQRANLRTRVRRAFIPKG